MSPRHAWLLALALLGAGSAGAEGRTSRRSVSVDGGYRIQMTVEAPGKCLLEVSTEGRPVWTLPRCVGGTEDAYFISRDGQRFWVVHTLPEKGQGKPVWKKKGKQRLLVAPGYAGVQVAEKFNARGERLASRRLSELLGRAGYGKVRELAHHFSWLEGVNGVPGKGPRLNDAGVVELETVEGRTVLLPLD
jgi:hypothetical protein